ncbi:anhydro-N-acetylmuramic acid kinase [Niabella digestorum]|uniref:Anhydro-N-acetylmuramic acid kinase n=1 Tax=Niabella digestorum TaxID=3117701 RepID=A0ABU7RG69_9BACT
MIYRAIGLMSGSSLDGLDIVFAEILENGGKWSYDIQHAECMPYPQEWVDKLKNATSLSALDYQLLHTAYGHYLGACVNDFIARHHLQFKVAVVASHGHTTFHLPAQKMTAQLGDGAAIAAVTKLPVVSDLRAMDVACGGQGAPIVPIGERLFFSNYPYLLNIGGIANVSINKDPYIAFDVCPANRVLNMLAQESGVEFDEGGHLARQGQLHSALLEELNALEYYQQPHPKSLANEFGTDIVYPLIKKYALSSSDALHTYTEHIAIQIKQALQPHAAELHSEQPILITGGGAFNTYLIERLTFHLNELNIQVVVGDPQLVKYKEALIMALIGVLRWREEYNVLSSVTGADRDSVGGALWMGQEA